MPKRIRSVTLIELIIAITLISVITIGFSSIEIFSRYHVLTADRRAKLQNEVSYILEHMAKNITGTATSGGAIGSVDASPVTINPVGAGSIVIIWADLNQNGRRDSYPDDHRIAYRYLASPHQIAYYSNYTGLSSPSEVIANHIAPVGTNPAFNVSYDNTTADGDPIDNYLEVTVSACWDPDGTPQACGTPDNPGVTMRNRIKMPSVSTN